MLQESNLPERAQIFLHRWILHCPSVLSLKLTASAAFGKQNQKQNIILLNSTFYNLFVDTLYNSLEFLENSAHTNFFLEDTHEGLK